jgi:ribokinase
VIVAALGDLVLDVTVRPLAAIAVDTDTPSVNRVEAGGQAANVAAWAAAAGAGARLVARRSSDPAGRLAEERVRARGVDVVGPAGPEPAGVIVSLLGDGGTRSMLTDRGAGPLLSAADLEARWFADVGWLHVSGYALAVEPACEAAREAARRVRDGGGRVSVDLASTAAIEATGGRVFAARVAGLQPALVFGTAEELRYVAADVAPIVVAKRGAAGALLRGPVEAERPSVADAVIDTTGAGDALAGGMLAALAAGAAYVAALEAGLRAAADCVGRRGAMPPTIRAAL